MKKKIIVLIAFLLAAIPISINAASMDSYVDWTLDKSVFAHQYRQGEDHITNLALMTADGNVAYCIQPGILADKASYYNSTSNIYDTGISNLNTNKINLIGYYGYKNFGHIPKEYYMAAQELIWREAGVENVWWTDAKEGGNVLNIDAYKNEILRLVNNYEVAPSFDFKKEYMVGDTIFLEDKNNVLIGYELDGNNSNVKIEKNKIIINVTDNNKFTLRRKQVNEPVKFFYKSGYQTIGSFLGGYDYKKDYDVKSTYGKIILHKLDKDGNSNDLINNKVTLKDASYTLYDENNKEIITKKTDELGNITFDNLSLGNYYIKETIPSTGYTLDKEVYNIKLNSDNFTREITSYEKIIENEIIINKILEDEQNGTNSPEEGIIFNIYDLDGNKVKEVKTDKKGHISFTLPFGTYKISQFNSPIGVTKVEDFIIKIDKDKELKKYLLINKKVKQEIITSTTKINELPNTGKNDIYMIFILLSSFISILYEYKKNNS